MPLDRVASVAGGILRSDEGDDAGTPPLRMAALRLLAPLGQFGGEGPRLRRRKRLADARRRPVRG